MNPTSLAMALGALLSACALPAMAQDAPARKLSQGTLTVEVFSEGDFVVPGGVGMKMFSNREAKLPQCPDELNGFLGIQTGVAKIETAIDFSVSEPVRIFGPLNHITQGGESKGRAAGVVPEGWKLYAFDVPWRDRKTDIYYKDFAAGRHTLVIGGLFFVPAIVPANRLSDAMRLIPSLKRPPGRDYFLPGDEASLVLMVDNQTTVSKEVEIVWKDIPTGNRKVLAGDLKAAAAPGANEYKLSLGKPAERGVYRVEVRISCADKTWRLWCPIGVFPKPEKRITWSENTFPMGLYLKPALVSGKFDTYTEPYFRAACDELSRRGFNIVKDTGCVKELNIAAEYGLKGITFFKDYYPPEMIKHPALAAAMVIDEATLDNAAHVKKGADVIASIRPDLPIVTCEVGESVGDYSKGDPLRVWPVLDAKLRMIRYYPFRKANYDLTRYMVYKGWLSVDSALRAAEAACGTPYWFVAQSFGRSVSAQRPEPYWRTPTATELKAQLHLALARGAQGLFFYTYQNEDDGEGMVDQGTLVPSENGLLDAATEFAQLTGKHARLLKELHFGGWIEAIPEHDHVLAVPRCRGADETGEKFLYLVNLDAKQAAAGDLIFSEKVKPFAHAEDIFTGKRLQPAKKNGRLSFHYELEPGGGALWRMVAGDKL
ncbi:MAG: hypothetical protein HY360_18620 [Verrucomicrobia bacterium]|nr:hypothetical protein [Verrucomicrobiota bacterium]